MDAAKHRCVVVPQINSRRREVGSLAAWKPPSPIVEEAARLRKTLDGSTSNAAREILSALETDPRMGVVWKQLYKTKRTEHRKTQEFLHPARVTNASIAHGLNENAARLRANGNASEAKMLEAEARWQLRQPEEFFDPNLSEQDYGVQIFFRKAFECATSIEPMFRKDVMTHVNKLRRVERALRRQADVLCSLGMDRVAAKVIKIAESCEDTARIKSPPVKKRDPAIIVRNRRDAPARTLAVDLSIESSRLFGDELPGLCARIANVVMQRRDITREMVQEWLRPPSVSTG